MYIKYIVNCWSLCVSYDIHSKKKVIYSERGLVARWGLSVPRCSLCIVGLLSLRAFDWYRRCRSLIYVHLCVSQSWLGVEKDGNRWRDIANHDQVSADFVGSYIASKIHLTSTAKFSTQPFDSCISHFLNVYPNLCTGRQYTWEKHGNSRGYMWGYDLGNK